MQKKSSLVFLGIFLSSLLVNFVSAYSYSLSLNDSLREISNLIDIHTFILALIFLLLFVGFFKLSNKVMGENHRSSSGVLAFIISFFLIWTINRSQITGNIENFWNYLGYSEGILSIILPIIILLVIIYLMIKIGSLLFLFTGLGLILISIFTDYIYEKEIITIIGICLLLIGLYLWNRKRKIKSGYPQRKLGIGIVFKIFFFVVAGVFFFINPIFGGIIFILWLLVILFTRKKTNRFYDKRIGSVEGMARGTGRAFKWGGKKTLSGAKAMRQRDERKVEKKKFNLARKIGINNLEKQLRKLEEDYQKGIKLAGELHKKATKLGWTKAGVKPRKGEDAKKIQQRATEASEAYRTWYRQYNKNINLEKQIKEIKSRMEHLKKQLKVN